jgi:hypothetical protein
MSGGLSLSEHAAAFFTKLRERPAIEIIVLLSLGLIIFHGFSTNYFSSAVAFLVLPALLYRPLLQHWLFWVLIAGEAAFVVFYEWYAIDNHKFLLFYWALALALAFSLPPEHRQAFLATTARFLLVFVMGGAVVQKTLDVSYLDGSFFEFTLLTDRRFEPFMTALGVDWGDLGYNREVINALRAAYLENDTSAAVLRSSPSVHKIALIVTRWDYWVQVAMAAAFLFETRWLDLLGHIILLVFVVTTYLAAPVIGFGWTLSILGYTLSAGRFPKITLCYLVTFPLLIVYDVQWWLFHPISGA